MVVLVDSHQGIGHPGIGHPGIGHPEIGMSDNAAVTHLAQTVH